MYDRLKWLVLIFLPAFSGLIAGLGSLYGIENIEVYVGTVNILTAFFGGLLQVSSRNYHDGDDGSGGSLVHSMTPVPKEDESTSQTVGEAILIKGGVMVDC
ncbi:phage holin [Fundicoccus ignavus]|uniref:phage holin n=1 Tax=Fundicoccus ignavus TaxID=2664442 RepID=UPI0031B64B27